MQGALRQAHLLIIHAKKKNMHEAGSSRVQERTDRIEQCEGKCQGIPVLFCSNVYTHAIYVLSWTIDNAHRTMSVLTHRLVATSSNTCLKCRPRREIVDFGRNTIPEYILDFETPTFPGPAG